MELFDKNERYAQAGLDLDKAIQDAIRPIIQQYIAQGASIRQSTTIAHAAIQELHASMILDLPHK